MDTTQFNCTPRVGEAPAASENFVSPNLVLPGCKNATDFSEQKIDTECKHVRENSSSECDEIRNPVSPISTRAITPPSSTAAQAMPIGEFSHAMLRGSAARALQEAPLSAGSASSLHAAACAGSVNSNMSVPTQTLYSSGNLSAGSTTPLSAPTNSQNGNPFLGVIPADFIRAVCKWLNLPCFSTATALCYYHKFDRFRRSTEASRSQELRSIDVMQIATAAVYLASKSTDNARKLRDVLNCAHRSLFPGSEVLPVDQLYAEKKSGLMASELLLLRFLAYDTNVELAYIPLIQYLNVLFKIKSPDKCLPELRALVQLSWTLVNDSYLRSTVVCQTPNCIAIAAIYLSLSVFNKGAANLPSLVYLIQKVRKPSQVKEISLHNVEETLIWMASTHINAVRRQRPSNIGPLPLSNTPNFASAVFKLGSQHTVTPQCTTSKRTI